MYTYMYAHSHTHETQTRKVSRIHYIHAYTQQLAHPNAYILIQMHTYNRWICGARGEKMLTGTMWQLFTNKTSGGCQRACGAHACLMVDIGANIGFFGMLAMTYGCQAVFFDIQRSCTMYVQGGMLANGFGNKGRVFHMGVSDVAAVTQVPDEDCGGGVYVRDERTPTHSGSADAYQNVHTVPLREVIPLGTQIFVMKVRVLALFL
jgi:hypothetical protein